MGGVCRTVEKSYFRLTSAPDPKTVRPPPVLVKALAMVEKRMGSYKSECLRKRDEGMVARQGMALGGDYFWAQDQLKSLRQDLTVQHIRSELAVAVYEYHARLALAYGEMADYTQCAR